VPFKTGEQLTLTIQDIAFGGEGVGRVDDFVVFVPFVLVGEVVEVEITEVKRISPARSFCASFSRRRSVSSRRAATSPNAAVASISTLITPRSFD